MPHRTWEQLEPLGERSWAVDYRLAPELVERYLRWGRRHPKGEPTVAVGIRSLEGEIVGVKFRRPPDGWGYEPIEKHKYLAAKGSKTAEAVFLASRLSGDTTVVLAAGEKDALVGASHLPDKRWDVVSGCAGEGTLTWLPALVELAGEGRDYVVCFDGDETGRRAAQDAATYLAGRGCVARVVAMPDGYDLTDVVLEHGPAHLEVLLEEAGMPVPPAPSASHTPDPEGDSTSAPKTTGDRSVTDTLDAWEDYKGRVVKWRRDKDGDVVGDVMFAGVPRVVSSELVWAEDPEHGWVSTRRCKFEAKLHPDGRTVRHSGEGFEGFSALVELCAGHNRCVTPSSMKLLYQWALRRAQRRSQTVRAAGYCGEERGWLFTPGLQIKGGKVRRYVSAVEPPGAQDLERYHLLELSEERQRELGDFVLRRLVPCDYADRAYTLPLLAAMLVGPVWTHVRAVSGWQRYALFLQGTSGVGKSQLLRHFMCFWGDFRESDGLSTWATTATALEELLYRVRGAPLYVGDWKRQNFGGIKGEKQAMRLIQSYGDRASRGRANQSAQLRAKRPPRCQLVIDGEDLPEGEQATLGRMVQLHVQAHRGGLCCEADSGPTGNLPRELVEELPGLTAGWIAWVQREEAWLGEWSSKIQAALEHKLRDQTAATNRRRIVRNHTLQLLALKGFFRFLEELGCDASLCQAHYARAVEVVLSQAGTQVDEVSRQSAGELFLEGLRDLLSAGEVYLEARVNHPTVEEPEGSGDSPWPKPKHSAARVGFYHHDVAHVLPQLVLDELERRRRGIPFGRRSIAVQLQERRLMEQDRVRLGSGVRQRCWNFAIEELTESYLDEATKEEEVTA